MRFLAGVVAAVWVGLCGSAAAQAPSIEEFTADVAFRGASMSPSGRYIAGIAQEPTVDRLVVIDWAAGTVETIGQAEHDVGNRDVHINWVSWKTEDRLIYSVASSDGRDNVPMERRDYTISRVQTVNRDGANVTELMGERFSAASFALQDILRDDPNHVLMLAGDRNGVAMWRVNLNNGNAQRVESASEYIGQWWVNNTGEAVLRVEYPRSGNGYRIARAAPGTDNWIDVIEVVARSFDENRDFLPFRAGPRPELFYVSARPPGADHVSVYLYNVATGELGEPVAQVSNADITSLMVMPATRELLAYCSYDTRRACRTVNPEFQTQWNQVLFQMRRFGDVSLRDVSDDGQTWLLYVEGPTNPGFFAVYSVAQQRLSVLTRVQPDLTAERLNPTEVVRYRTRDNVELWGYLTRPAGVTGPAPLVMMPHGGPEARDYFEYDFLVQFLASRGYAVFQPQFRGSDGFGRAFAEQGYGQWGGRMQDDVTDALQHMVQTGVTTADRACIVGISYGAYSALAGAAFTPTLYRCAVGIAGVYDLSAFARSERRSYGSSSMPIAYWRRSLGTVSDRAALDRVSPSVHVQNINIPILLVHGTEDYTTELRQAEIMRDALNGAGKNLRYVEVDFVGHPYNRWREGHRAQLLRELEAFLNTNLRN